MSFDEKEEEKGKRGQEENMVNWTSRFKKGGGWFFESDRHRRARLYGKAGGAAKSRKYMQEYTFKDDRLREFFERLAEQQERQRQQEKMKARPKTKAKTKKETGFRDISGLQEDNESERLIREATGTDKPLETPFFGFEPLEVSESRRSDYVRQIKSSIEGGKSVDFALSNLAGDPKSSGYADRLKEIKNAVGAGELAKFRRLEGKVKSSRREEWAEKNVPLYAQTDLKKGVDTIIPQHKSPTQRLSELQTERNITKIKEQEQREKDAWARDLVTGGDVEHSPFDKNNQGVFDPLGNMGVDSEIHPMGEMFDFGQESSSTQKQPDTLADHTKFLVDDFFNSKNTFRENKIMDRFYDGEQAFKSGDREKLSNAIIDLGFEQRKLEDRKHVLDMTRSKVLQDQNIVEMMHKEKEGDTGNIVFGGGSLFGGSVGSQVADQTDKITKTESEVYKQIHKAKSMTQNLRQKLARLDANTDYSKFEPQSPVMAKNPYGGESKSGAIGGITNPLTSGLKNPLFGSEQK